MPTSGERRRSTTEVVVPAGVLSDGPVRTTSLARVSLSLPSKPTWFVFTCLFYLFFGFSFAFENEWLCILNLNFGTDQDSFSLKIFYTPFKGYFNTVCVYLCTSYWVISVESILFGEQFLLSPFILGCSSCYACFVLSIYLKIIYWTFLFNIKEYYSPRSTCLGSITCVVHWPVFFIFMLWRSVRCRFDGLTSSFVSVLWSLLLVYFVVASSSVEFRFRTSSREAREAEGKLQKANEFITVSRPDFALRTKEKCCFESVSATDDFSNRPVFVLLSYPEILLIVHNQWQYCVFINAVFSITVQRGDAIGLSCWVNVRGG